MAFLGSLLRSRRGDFNLLLIAALVALLVMPGASHAAIAPQSAAAVLLWLQSESAVIPSVAPATKASELLALSHQNPEKSPQSTAETQFSGATLHCGQHLALLAPENTTRHENPTAAPNLERHAVAHLSGVRTNRRLN